MNNDGANPPQPVTDALAAAGTFVNSLQEEDQIGVVTFATRAELTTQLNNIHGAVANAVLGLVIEPASEVGFTNTPAALEVAMAELNSERHNDNARRVLVLLTDGLPTASGETDIVAQAVATAQAVSESGIEVYVIGLGQDVDADFVRSIASDASNAFFAPSGSDLASIYAEITTSLCEAGEGKIEIVAKTKTNFAPLR
jgi:Ca-activated chloride channel family protein